MQSIRFPFKNIKENDFKVIHRELQLDDDKIHHVLKLIKEWIEREEHLPKNIDEVVLITFIMKCKGNLDKTKEKLERFLIAKTQMPHFFKNRVLNDDSDPYMTHRAICVTNKITPNGNRVIIMRFPTKDVTHLNHLKACKYFVLVFEALLYHDKCAGYHFVFDAQNMNMQSLGKINLTLQTQLLQLMYLILPFRVRSVHILNGNAAFDVLFNIAKMFMSKKLKSRVHNSKSCDLLNFFPQDCIPVDYGGNEKSCDEICDKFLTVLKENEKWYTEIEKLELMGDLPGKTENVYSFEDFDMMGSFRKLELD